MAMLLDGVFAEGLKVIEGDDLEIVMNLFHMPLAATFYSPGCYCPTYPFRNIVGIKELRQR